MTQSGEERTMHRMTLWSMAVLALALAAPKASVAATSCPNPPKADPDNFPNGANVTNRYFPLKVGKTYVYKGKEDGESVTDRFTVTNQTKEFKINGGTVTGRVVHDRLFSGGELKEDTFDWFAQDKDGTVWYFGEDTKELDNGQVVSTEGSWEAGVNGAKPGIIMEAHPKVGDKYKQEDAKGVAEDCAQILSLTASVKVPYASFSNVLKTKEFSLLEPGVVDNKWYAKKVGEVKEATVKGGNDFLNLVSVK
jgi:hypothetical protein